SYGAPSVSKHWRFLLYLAGGWLLVGTGLVQPYFRDSGYTDLSYYGWLVGLNPDMPVTPVAVLSAVARPEALLMVAGVIASLGAVPLLAPRWLLLAIPPYLAAVLSEHAPQNLLHLHYVLPLLFPLLAAAAVGGRWWLQRRPLSPALDRKSTRLNSSHEWISYAVFCLKKKKATELRKRRGTHQRRWTRRGVLVMYRFTPATPRFSMVESRASHHLSYPQTL